MRKTISRLHSRIARALGREGDPRSGERGATLVLATAALVVLLGMAGFAVDLGWLYLKTAEAKKAAEAAALAGVVHMPNPSSVPWGPGAAGFDTAVDVAARNGYPTGAGVTVAPQPVVGKPNQLHVDISTSVNTFFMKLFGINAVSFTRDATAEQLPPLKLGSDESYLGTDPDGGAATDRHFWASINGERRRKEDGDPFSTRCHSQNCSGTTNPEFRDPAYYYGIEVPSGGLGALNVEIYDAPHIQSGLNLPGDNGSGSTINDEITFTLFAPDTSPNDPTDNPVVLCSRTFTDLDGTAADSWVSLPCNPASVKGIYVLSVAIEGDDTAISSFSIRARVGGTSNVAVYGLGSMSLWMDDAGVAPNFKVVKLEAYYAGTELIISLFDPGDVSGGTADLRFYGEAATMDCEVRVLDADGGLVQDWHGDDSPGAAPCELQTAPKIYNNQWLELKFDVPDAYGCAVDCWVTVDYDLGVGAQVTERTTWAARINGQPIHLLP